MPTINVPNPMSYPDISSLGLQSSNQANQWLNQGANAQGQYNVAQYPSTVQSALAASMDSAVSLSNISQQQAYGQMDYLAPGWRTNMVQPAQTALTDTIMGISSQTANVDYWQQGMRGGQNEALLSMAANPMLRGQLPGDVEAVVRQAASESSVAQGMFGQSAQARTARDLGLTSLGMMQQGAALETQASTLRANNQALAGGALQIAGAPITGLSNFMTSLASLRPQLPDTQQLFTENMAQLSSLGFVSPTTTAQTGAAVYGQNLTTAYDIAASNQSLLWAAEQSRLDLWTDAQNRELSRDLD